MIYDWRSSLHEIALWAMLFVVAVGLVAVGAVYGKSGATKIQEAQELEECRLLKKKPPTP